MLAIIEAAQLPVFTLLLANDRLSDGKIIPSLTLFLDIGHLVEIVRVIVESCQESPSTSP